MDKIKLTALSRTTVERNHALVTGDGFVNSVVPGWTGCEVNVVISKAMGAGFSQLITTMTSNGVLEGETGASQLFFYVLEGACTVITSSQKNRVEKGSYVYIPVHEAYKVFNSEEGTTLLSFHKEYEVLKGVSKPGIIINTQASIEKTIYCGDPNLLMQNLLPDENNLSFDMAVNIFTYNPGANLPFVETHIMEHGLLYLQGQGIYRLDDKWYPVKKGDCIWMAPYCPQWFGALGVEPAVYIYYKNVNRLPEIM
ncbi:(S)-ureidoglycine aminohydrolase [Tamlana sp. 2201CG12-4]|uniref:(S)-ureidoglycine aminohydrolase n=1 Tax=Tamlana sp. 2201CG12-4 TaxID=3112582 RepID=UPI002DBCF712|nr:(S)-ureidoglycine aminohydrolase [Tamlana sp. 2201CG12-4]MEC3906754.1 (S)-ureidoglycine aminohydrolase [Tamlana sp. 2201CG12-4]